MAADGWSLGLFVREIAALYAGASLPEPPIQYGDFALWQRGRLGRARAAALGAYDHQDVPFERLVEELNVERSLAVSPLFQVMLVLQNVPLGVLELPGLVLRPVEVEAQAARLDLTLTLFEEDTREETGLRGSLLRAAGTQGFAAGADGLADAAHELAPSAISLAAAASLLAAAAQGPAAAASTRAAAARPLAASARPLAVSARPLAVSARPRAAAANPSAPAAQTPPTLVEERPLRSRSGWERPDIPPQSPAYVIYTSGSTGRPKGVVATRLISRFRDVFGVDLPLGLVFERPTLEALAAAVDEASARREGLAVPPLVARHDGETRFPLSFAQERLWFLDRMQPRTAPGTASYNVPVALRLTGPLDVSALTRALAGIVDRHSALRAVFGQDEGEAFNHTHLLYALELPEEPDEVQRELHIVKEGAYLFSVKNPEAASPPSAGLEDERKADFPPELQERFGDRRFIGVHPPAFLDHEGAEILLMGSAEDPGEELGVELDPERETEATADLFKELRIARETHPVEPLLEGRWA